MSTLSTTPLPKLPTYLVLEKHWTTAEALTKLQKREQNDRLFEADVAFQNLSKKKLKLSVDQEKVFKEQEKKAVTIPVRYALFRLPNNDEIGDAISSNTLEDDAKIHFLTCEFEGKLKISDANTIGSRWETSDASHICINDIYVSLIHTRIRWIKMNALNCHEVLISDGARGTPSMSGTFVNGTRLSSTIFTKLHLGDIISIGGKENHHPRFQLIDLEKCGTFSNNAQNVCRDLMGILTLSKTFQRISSDDLRDKKHLDLYQHLMNSCLHTD